MRASLIALLAIILLAAGARSSTFEIDAKRSKVQFTVQHIYVDQVSGTVPVISGSVVIPGDSNVPARVDVVLDPTKIKTGDDDRDGVLQTPDWFDTKKFPTWTFASTRIAPEANGSFTIDGLLTLHGVTQPERLTVRSTGSPDRPSFHATGQIDRHAFGMVVGRLDPAIGNPVEIVLDVALK